MYLSEKQIKDYQTDGVIVVKDIFKDWIEPLRKGFQKVIDNPSKHGRENVIDNNGRFFEDYCNWERIEEFKNCMFNSPWRVKHAIFKLFYSLPITIILKKSTVIINYVFSSVFARIIYNFLKPFS